MFIKKTDTEHIKTHYSYTTLEEQASSNLHIHAHREDNGETKGESRRIGGTFIVKWRQTDYSPAALSPTSRDGSISSSRHTQQRCLKCFLFRNTHTHTLNLHKPVATWLELRNVAASAVVIQQGGMGLVREKEREMGGGKAVKQEVRLIY